ncbi:MAG: AAA family ATPase [bacterium]|nr:AAA family ATPase [bacterium]
MAIKHLRVKNFKSFRDLDLELGDFNVLIGANASGKSNFVQIFRFLRDIAKINLRNAISLQGGVEYLRNINLTDEPLEVSVVDDGVSGALNFIWGSSSPSLTVKNKYEFKLNFDKKNSNYLIEYDRNILEYTLSKLVHMEIDNNYHRQEYGVLEEGLIKISNQDGRITLEPESGYSKKLKPFMDQIKHIISENVLNQKLMIEDNFLSTYFVLPNITETSIYDIDPKLLKNPHPLTGKLYLDDDGANLAIVLNEILRDRDKFRLLMNIIRDALPFIDGIEVEHRYDSSILIRFKEIYSIKEFMPVPFLSNGTMHITALIIALFIENDYLTIIEEPERNIHPKLISKIVNMMKDASRNKQIIVTTHNPEVVKHAGIENLLLVTRDKDGYSVIKRPQEMEEVKIFLKNEIGIDELFVNNLLEF